MLFKYRYYWDNSPCDVTYVKSQIDNVQTWTGNITPAQYSTVQYTTVQYSILQYSTVQYYTVTKNAYFNPYSADFT